MKKIGKGLLVLCLFSMAPMGLSGQTIIGVRGGLTSAKVTGNDLTDATRRSGFAIGGFVALGVGDAIGLDIGATYTQKGVAALDGGTELKIDLDYVEFPLLARVSLPTVGRVSPRLSIGPVLAFEVGCEVAATQVELTITVDCDDPGLDGDLDTTSFDLGALVGAGASIRLGGRARFSLDVMYNDGLKSIVPDEVQDPNKNQTFMVTGSFSLMFGGRGER